MKRTLLDITQKISRKVNRTVLTPKDLNNATHFIWEASGWKFVDILREVELRETQDRLKIIINTQFISAEDYVIEQSNNSLLVKFIKSRFSYNLDSDDFVEVYGDIEQYN